MIVVGFTIIPYAFVKSSEKHFAFLDLNLVLLPRTERERNLLKPKNMVSMFALIVMVSKLKFSDCPLPVLFSNFELDPLMHTVHYSRHPGLPCFPRGTEQILLVESKKQKICLSIGEDINAKY